MNVLIVDFLFADAHKDFNTNIINAISQFADVDVISLNGYYDNVCMMYPKRIQIVNLYAERKTGTIGARFHSLNLMKQSAKLLKEKVYDAVFCLGFETIITGLAINKFRGTPVFLFHHKNIDELTNKTKKIMFGLYMRKVYHIVFEEFFGKRLIEDIAVPSNRVFVSPHPAKMIPCVQTDKTYDCVGLCNSNDERFISDAINRSKEFEDKGVTMLLRSKTVENSGKAVEVIKGFLQKEVYDELIAAGKSVFVPLPSDYIYRLSGSIYDAISRGKPVYTTSKFYAEEYERRYPGILYYVESVEDLMLQLLNRKDFAMAELSFRKFIDEHSIKATGQRLEEIIGLVMKE